MSRYVRGYVQCSFNGSAHNVALYIPMCLCMISPTACTNPKVKSSTYTTENQYFSSENVYIAQVEVDCGGEVCNQSPYAMTSSMKPTSHTHTHMHTHAQSLSLHALVGDQLLPVSKGITSTTSEQFQVYTNTV